MSFSPCLQLRGNLHVATYRQQDERLQVLHTCCGVPCLLDATAYHLIVSHAGQGRGHVSITAEGELRLSLVWDDPHGGSGYDLYHLVDYNTMYVKSFICVDNGTVNYNVMYRRKG